MVKAGRTIFTGGGTGNDGAGNDGAGRDTRRKALAWLAFALAACLLVLGWLGGTPAAAKEDAAAAAKEGEASRLASQEPLTTASSQKALTTASGQKALTTAEVLAAAPAADWRPLDPANTLYLDLDGGRVVVELAPGFAPRHVEAIKAMVRAGAKGAAVNRVQDNFVTQWQLTTRPAPTLEAEFTRADDPALGFTPLPDGDVYAPETGFVDELPAARDTPGGTAWLVHCYGMVGVGRENEPDSGNGAELYAVIGHAPRQLDRNITLVGRVVSGMEHLSSLPRGQGAMGFYEAPAQPIPFKAVRLAADVPPAEQEALEILRTDSQSFTALVESRRNRQDAFYHVPANAIDVCNVPIPVRERATQVTQAE